MSDTEPTICLPASTLQDTERNLTAALYAVWKAQGVNKRIINADKERTYNPQRYQVVRRAPAPPANNSVTVTRQKRPSSP